MIIQKNKQLHEMLAVRLVKKSQTIVVSTVLFNKLMQTKNIIQKQSTIYGCVKGAMNMKAHSTFHTHLIWRLVLHMIPSQVASIQLKYISTSAALSVRRANSKQQHQQ